MRVEEKTGNRYNAFGLFFGAHDSFAGSGTTGSVAHEMGRRWIMVELDEHCHTHIILRLKKLIDGEDPDGITKAVNWKGGGGFRYCRLAPSLLELCTSFRARANRYLNLTLKETEAKKNEEIGNIPVPLKYQAKDFLKAS